jgi:hypothetical protein
VCSVLVAALMYVQVGFAVADGGAALHDFTNSLKAPGAMTVPIESTHDNGTLQQLTLVKKASGGQHQQICSLPRADSSLGRLRTERFPAQSYPTPCSPAASSAHAMTSLRKLNALMPRSLLMSWSLLNTRSRGTQSLARPEQAGATASCLLLNQLKVALDIQN